MYEIFILTIIMITFLLAGSIKGVVGFGLPAISLGVLAIVIDLTSAMALMLLPSLVTNAWQAFSGGNGKLIVRRIWPFLLLAAVPIMPAAGALVTFNPLLLSMLLGVLLVAYASFSLSGYRFSISAEREKWAGPILGAINGVLTGMTGSFVVPGLFFLQAIGLPRDMLVQAMGMLFCLSTLVLAFSLRNYNLLTTELAMLSALAVVPAVVGMMIGQRIRRSMEEQRFRHIVYLAIFVLGGLIVIKAVIVLS